MTDQTNDTTQAASSATTDKPGVGERVYHCVQSFMKFLHPKTNEPVVFVNGTLKTSDPTLIDHMDKEVVTNPAMGVYKKGEEPGASNHVHDSDLAAKQLAAFRANRAQANAGGSTAPGTQAASVLGAASTKDSALTGGIKADTLRSDDPNSIRNKLKAQLASNQAKEEAHQAEAKAKGLEEDKAVDPALTGQVTGTTSAASTAVTDPANPAPPSSTTAQS